MYWTASVFTSCLHISQALLILQHRLLDWHNIRNKFALLTDIAKKRHAKSMNSAKVKKCNAILEQIFPQVKEKKRTVSLVNVAKAMCWYDDAQDMKTIDPDISNINSHSSSPKCYKNFDLSRFVRPLYQEL